MVSVLSALSLAFCKKPQEEQPQKGTKKQKNGNEKKLTCFFIKKYDQLLCLNRVSLRAFLRLFVAIFRSLCRSPRLLQAPELSFGVCLDSGFAGLVLIHNGVGFIGRN